MPTSTVVNHTKARLARAHRTYGSSSPQVADARRDLAAAKLEDYIRRTVDAAPPLTTEQRDRLAVLLRGDAA